MERWSSSDDGVVTSRSATFSSPAPASSARVPDAPSIVLAVPSSSIVRRARLPFRIGVLRSARETVSSRSPRTRDLGRARSRSRPHRQRRRACRSSWRRIRVRSGEPACSKLTQPQVFMPSDRLPRADPLVGFLLDDLGIPLGLLSGNRCRPVNERVIELVFHSSMPSINGRELPRTGSTGCRRRRPVLLTSMSSTIVAAWSECLSCPRPDDRGGVLSADHRIAEIRNGRNRHGDPAQNQRRITHRVFAAALTALRLLQLLDRLCHLCSA